MRSSACDTLSRCCARHVLRWLAFPSAPALRSTGSAASYPALFVGFPATMAESDFPVPFIIGYGSSPSQCGPAGTRPLARPGTSRFPPKELRHMPGSSTPPGQPSARDNALGCVAFRFRNRVGTRKFGFRGSMAGLRPPLPTLRRRPYGRHRTARGRCGSLLLHRVGLSPTTPCRSPGALRIRPPQPWSRSLRWDFQGRRQTFVAESTLAGPRGQSARDAPLIASSWSR